MVDPKNELEELSQEIRKIITDNNNFVSRILDDDFEVEEEEESEGVEGSEEMI